MGNRGNISLKYKNGEKIYFYSHWGGDNESLSTIVRDALIRGKDRWGDESYLARIIFSEMIKEEVEKSTGYGIAPYQIDAGGFVEIDLGQQTVNNIPFEMFVSPPK